MTKRLSYCHILISLVLVASGCASKPVRTVEFGDRVNSRHRVLIATQQSAFKEAVVSEVIDGLERVSCYIRIIDLADLEEESTANYDAIVIANKCIAWRPSREVERFVGRVREKDKIVLLVTAGSGECSSKPLQVDAMTSASTMDNSGVIARSIVDKVRVLLRSVD